MIPGYPLFHHPFFCLCFPPLFFFQESKQLLWSLYFLDIYGGAYNRNIDWSILSPTCNNSSDCFVFSPSINLKKKKSLNSTRKLKNKGKKKGQKRWKEKQNQRNKKGILSDPELFFSRLELRCLLSLQLTIVGSNTSVEAPMRYLCVRFWHVLHSMHLTCLRARKFAPCTHLSHFWHKSASSAWQYNDALDPHSSQQTNLEVALDETTSPPQEPPWLSLSWWIPLHIFRISLKMEWTKRKMEEGHLYSNNVHLHFHGGEIVS